MKYIIETINGERYSPYAETQDRQASEQITRMLLELGKRVRVTTETVLQDFGKIHTPLDLIAARASSK